MACNLSSSKALHSPWFGQAIRVVRIADLSFKRATVAHAVADIVRELGETFLDTESPWSRLGAVEVRPMRQRLLTRARMPKQWFLMPGVGAQGAVLLTWPKPLSMVWVSW